MKRSKLTIFIISLLLVGVIAFVAHHYGVRFDGSGTFPSVTTNRFLYLARSFNIYQFTSFWYRAVLYLYWYAVSLIVSYFGFTLARRYLKNRDRRAN